MSGSPMVDYPELASLEYFIKIGHDRANRSRRMDDLFHNWGIALAIALGTIGTGLPPNWDIWSKICTGTATAIFAIERSLEFGSRWRFHRRIRNGYRKAQMRLGLAKATADSADRKVKIDQIIKVVDSVLDMDNEIPGAGADTYRQSAS